MAFFGVAFFVGGIILGVYYFSATSVAMPLLLLCLNFRELFHPNKERFNVECAWFS